MKAQHLFSASGSVAYKTPEPLAICITLLSKHLTIVCNVDNVCGVW